MSYFDIEKTATDTFNNFTKNLAALHQGAEAERARLVSTYKPDIFNSHYSERRFALDNLDASLKDESKRLTREATKIFGDVLEKARKWSGAKASAPMSQDAKTTLDTLQLRSSAGTLSRADLSAAMERFGRSYQFAAGLVALVPPDFDDALRSSGITRGTEYPLLCDILDRCNTAMSGAVWNLNPANAEGAGASWEFQLLLKNPYQESDQLLDAMSSYSA
jgi:hypothetical protein